MAKRVPLEKLPLPKLVKKADDWFSKYVRIRDCEKGEGCYVGTCITCSKTGPVAFVDEGKIRFVKGWNAGHYVTRGNKVVRFNEMNVNLQCAFRCNNMRSGEVVKYRIALKEKYGDEAPKELEDLAESTQYYKFSREELLEIINNAKEFVGWAESHA